MKPDLDLVPLHGFHANHKTQDTIDHHVFLTISLQTQSDEKYCTVLTYTQKWFQHNTLPILAAGRIKTWVHQSQKAFNSLIWTHNQLRFPFKRITAFIRPARIPISFSSMSGSTLQNVGLRRASWLILMCQAMNQKRLCLFRIKYATHMTWCVYGKPCCKSIAM